MGKISRTMICRVRAYEMFGANEPSFVGSLLRCHLPRLPPLGNMFKSNHVQEAAKQPPSKQLPRTWPSSNNDCRTWALPFVEFGPCISH